MIEALFHQYYSPLVNYCRVVLHDEDLAQDIVQELFISVWQNSNLGEIKDVKSYLFKIAKNKCMDHHRKKRITELYPDFKEDIRGNEEHHTIKEEDIEPIFSYCLSFLKQNEREVFVLNRIEGLTYREISERQNKPIKTIESQISRALKTLRDVSTKILSCLIIIYTLLNHIKL